MLALQTLPRRLLSNLPSSLPSSLPSPLTPGTILPTYSLSYPSSANASFAVLTGGSTLASNSSHDPNYENSQSWISAHPVGPTLLDPAILQGGLNTLISSWIPGLKILGCTMSNYTPSVPPFVVGEEVTLYARVVTAKAGNEGVAGWDLTIKASGRRARGGSIDYSMLEGGEGERTRNGADGASGSHEDVCVGEWKVFVGEYMLSKTAEAEAELS